MPVEDSRAVLQHVQDLEDDELEHGARESEVDAEDDLDEDVAQLVVFEQLLDEEDPADDEEHQLGAQHCHRITEKSHFGSFASVTDPSIQKAAHKESQSTIKIVLSHFKGQSLLRVGL